MHVSGELIVSHLLSAQVLRDNLPGLDLQVGVAEQHAVKVKTMPLYLMPRGPIFCFRVPLASGFRPELR